MTINHALARLARIFVVAYVLLFVRQLYVQLVLAPHLAANPHNPRLAALVPFRGSILARDGTPLAISTARGRAYPFGAALAHVVGYASARYGTAGLEAAYDPELTAHPAGSDPVSQLEALFARRQPAAARRGATLITTIDPAVQQALYGALAAYPRAAGVALDPRSGEVLALASVPSFDPAHIDASFGSLANDPASPLLDRSLDGLYAPGSTFKIFTAAAALEAGVVSMQSTYDDPGTYSIGNFSVHDDEGEATGVQDLTGAFAHSSNVDFAQIALALGSERWFEAAARWKLGEAFGFALPVERDRLPSRADVGPGVLAQLGFGQAGLLVTPLRMATIAATVAAGGTTPRPFLVRALRTGGRDTPAGAASTLATPISPVVATDLRTMMIAVVQRGTGTAAALGTAQVAGKTGTATNPAGRSHAWFVAFAPADDPRVAVAIVVENAGYGGSIAAPIARRVIAAALARERG